MLLCIVTLSLSFFGATYRLLAYNFLGSGLSGTCWSRLLRSEIHLAELKVLPILLHANLQAFDEFEVKVVVCAK